MNLEKLNTWLTLSANVGVIAGIVFLAYELGQNREMMRAQTRDSITEKLANWSLEISTDPIAAQILVNGNRGEELNLETGEQAAYNLMVQSNFRLWENEWYQYQIGLFAEHVWVRDQQHLLTRFQRHTLHNNMRYCRPVQLESLLGGKDGRT